MKRPPSLLPPVRTPDSYRKIPKDCRCTWMWLTLTLPWRWVRTIPDRDCKATHPGDSEATT